MFSACWRSPVRSTISRRKRSISSVAIAPELVVQRFAGFELFAVDQQRARTGKRVAVLVEVPEERQATVFERGRSVLILPLKARDVVVNQLRCGGVVADDDEARRHPMPSSLPQRESLCIVTVERFQRRLQLRREA